jgi:chromosome segregation ATPase
MSAITASELQQRLSEQLQALSQVGETLTLRLLELEERLGALEEVLLELDSRSGGHDDLSAEAGEVLAATEERIARLEDLLTGQAGSMHSSRGRVQPLPLRRPERQSTAAAADAAALARAADPEGSPDGEPELELDPFPPEEEQPFMDELSA